MPKMDLRKFKGKLQEPLKPSNQGLLNRAMDKATDNDSRGREIVEKLELLLEHYGLSEPAKRDPLTISAQYMRLSYLLARDAGIKGFQEEKKRGRKKKWNDEVRACLVADIVRVQSLSDRNISVRSAANILSKKEPWKSFIESKEDSLISDPGEILRQIYSESKNSRWVNIYTNYMRQLVNDNRETEWIMEVSSIVKN